MQRLNQSRVRTIGYCQQDPSITSNIDELRGEGVFDWVKDKATSAISSIGSIGKKVTGRPKVMNDFIKLRGNYYITHIQVCREPISGGLKKFMNVISFGALDRSMKKLGYDQLFHLWMAVHLNNGEVWNLEKNQRVSVKEGKRVPNRKRGGACTPLKKVSINVRHFIEKAEKENRDGDMFYRYSPFKYNCQRWVRTLLNIHGIEQFDTFILQDTDKLVPGALKKLGSTITDIAAVADVFHKGGANCDCDDVEYCEC